MVTLNELLELCEVKRRLIQAGLQAEQARQVK